MKKTLILIVLFVLPIVAYLFFASGVNNFGKLPELTQNVNELNFANDIKFKKKITILGFLGDNVDLRKGNAFNLNQKIYKRFHEFKDFQFVMVMPIGTEDIIQEIKKDLANLADIEKWNFIFATPQEIESLFFSLKTDIQLDGDFGTPYVFIIDKNLSLRGRTADEDEGTKYGFNSNSVADLNNKMVDDVKIILAEYRLALKKNNPDRTK
ncbi:hypothetical protein [Maribacter sp. ACAM166]|uniref:hypothetical protein n=1 Tax=Maribacter sp. ACAM166 TaxID=2508996 RepID=UPI0010FCE1E4|nr:hypothetical protein [Maribacter sp. ACAM166]TLP82266.1 hypothetical protein ES765_02195 [Maribacter sp. ACAM166]